MLLAEAALFAQQQAAGRVAAADFAAKVRREFGSRVTELRLFGSLARGDWLGPDESDIDVAVLLKGCARADEMRLVELAGQVSREHELVVAPRGFSPEEFAAMRERERALALAISREGVRL